MTNDKIKEEILHDKKIASKAELIWGWGTPSGKKRAMRRGRYFIDLGKINRETKVLELGCGTGIFTEQLSLSGANIIAIDISADLLAQSRATVKASNVIFCEVNAEKMYFKENYFDCVVGSSILHHIELSSALAEIKRVLKPGGKFVFAEPNLLNPQIFMERKIKFIGKILHNTPHETAFLRWKLKKSLQQAGFKNILVKPYDFLHPWTPVCFIGLVEKIGLCVEKIPLFKEISGSLIIYGEK